LRRGKNRENEMQAHRAMFDRLIEEGRHGEPIAVAVVYPLSEISLAGTVEAAGAGLITPYLVGPRGKIVALAHKHNVKITPYPIVDVADDTEAAERGVELCRVGTCQALMKGSLHTDLFLRPVTPRDTGLRVNRQISHAFVLDAPKYPRTLIITDAAINVHPNLEEKADIVQNAIDLAHLLGIATPKVAVLSAVETVCSRIDSTVDAAALCKMADRGQIKGGTLDGPLAFDDATQPEAARIKRIRSAVAGHADILVAPDLESGNLLMRELESLLDVDAAEVVLGAQVPIILTSRAGNAKTRLVSIALAALLASQDRHEQVTSGFGVLLSRNRRSGRDQGQR
jgi:phosphate acetyltransferase